MQMSNYVGRLITETGKIDLIKMDTPGARPYGIALDAAGRPWFDLFGTNKIGTWDPRTLALKEYPLPDAKARPRRIALTRDGGVWYVDYTRGFLGRLDPATGSVREWKNPGGAGSLPYAMTVDDADRLWFVETGPQPNRLVGFDSKGEHFISLTNIPSGGGAVRYMIFDPKTRMIWFGTDNGTIGRAQVPPAAYLKAQPEESREALGTLRRMIRKAAPRAKESMGYGMATWSAGHRMLFALANQKKHLALYIGDTPLVAKHRARLGVVDCGKSCIRFKRLDDLDLDGVGALLAEAARKN
jgi:uncharacterized protein YdhG (YjbR/CyaY superfamily)